MAYKIFDGENFSETSKYALVIGVSKRARQLMSGEEPLINPQNHKAVVVALQEIEQDRVYLTTKLKKPSFDSDLASVSGDFTETPEQVEEI